MEVERQYVEIKVSFIHIVVLLVGVIVIGIFLFYLGYQAGKSSERNQILQAELPETGKTDEIQLVDQNKKTPGKKAKSKEPSIKDEIKLHQLPSTSTPDEKNAKIEPKSVRKESYFSVQVGAFSEYSNAKNYAAKFANMGYPTEIKTTVKNDRKLYRVRVGNFKTRAAAQQERLKLEKMENKKFAVVKPD